MTFNNIDLGIFIVYLPATMGLGIYVAFQKTDTAKDYFLASKSLPWWIIGGSLIASNISAEQFIGMSGSGYVVGMAIASYELMAAATLVIVAKFFLPVFINKGIYTMPQFLEQRYDHRVRTGLAIFWILLFVFVNITSVLYLGGLAIKTIFGVPLFWAVLGLVIYSSTFSIFGGLKAVVWTEAVQVVVLIFGGLVTSYLVLQAVGGDFWNGLKVLVEKAPEKFDMILDKSNPEYSNLPGISVLVGGMWIANLYYWGNNQYIVQRALAARSVKEGQRGTVFAAFLKLLLPFIVVLPGIAAFVLGADIDKPDQAYPWILSRYVTVGIRGLALAALVAAIGSSISAMVNSASTIFTLDIYNNLINKGASEKRQVKVGQIAATVALLIGFIMAPQLGSMDQVFQYIQEYTGFISPGIVAIFLFGLFWKKTSANAALWVVILSIPVSAGMKVLLPDFPFMDRMGVSFLIMAAILVIVSMMENKGADDPKGFTYAPGTFKTDTVFNIASLVIFAILAIIYYKFW